ncbi:MAG TPA: HAMP domain-containing sensor histidine kinase [Acidobacteriota bacterium]|nr:HAMP domain-containing sensor histidine kinase [Acidobacteriota bacterium]
MKEKRQQPAAAARTGSPGLANWSKRRLLWVGFAAVLVPLTALMLLQYRWLVDLQYNSALAQKAAMRGYADLVAEKVEYFFRKNAERALNVPSAVLEKDRQDQLSYLRQKKKDIEGARLLFLIRFQDERIEEVFYDPASKQEAEPVRVDLLYLKTLHKYGKTIDSELKVDDSDPDNAVIFKPITDECSRLLGVAGMLVDTDYLRSHHLPDVIRKTLPSMPRQEDLAVLVRDGEGNQVFAEGDLKTLELPDKACEVSRKLPFIFRTWQVCLSSGSSTPEQLARANFLFNMTLSGVLGILLAGGVLLTFRTAAREMKLSEMKNDFVSNVSHELRTPLASIRVFGEMLRLGKVREASKVREYGEYIEAEGRRLSQLINNILNFAKIESGQKVYEFESCDLEKVIEKVVSTFRVRLQHSGVEIDFSKPLGSLPPLNIDGQAVSQAISNLLDNAVKYSNGARRIEVALKRSQDEAVISVRDQGIGISREEQSKIFERFHRVSTGLVHDVKGSGLGLSIVQHIVRAHGGRVEVESEAGQGSTFFIILPLRPDAAKQTTRSGPEAMEGGPQAAGEGKTS